MQVGVGGVDYWNIDNCQGEIFYTARISVRPPKTLSFRGNYTLKLGVFHKASSMVPRKKPRLGFVLSNETTMYFGGGGVYGH